MKNLVELFSDADDFVSSSPHSGNNNYLKVDHVKESVIAELV